MPSVEAPSCQHIKINGEQCGGPALRGRRYCRFHDDAARRQRHSIKLAKDPFTRHTFNPVRLPVLEDANAVQVALMETVNAMLDGRINEQRAGLLLYALQTASANLKNVNFLPPSHMRKGTWAATMLEALHEIRDQSQTTNPPDAVPQLPAPVVCESEEDKVNS